MSQLCQPLAPGDSTPAPTISSCSLISPLVFVSHRKMFLPFRHNQRGKCPSLTLSSGEKGGLGNRGRSKAAWLTVPLGNGPKSQGFLLRLWVTEGMGWGEWQGPLLPQRDPGKLTRRTEAASLPFSSCQLYWQWPQALGSCDRMGIKTTVRAVNSQDVHCPRQVVPGSRPQDIL